ncbi:MAG: DUF3108 domain-containing protein [Oligoflexia bacterium]|nr:DUF3108 domain-containing protein [Oligoflexia bacterium]
MILFLNACASKNDRSFIDFSSKDVEKKFDASKDEKFKKFFVDDPKQKSKFIDNKTKTVKKTVKTSSVKEKNVKTAQKKSIKKKEVVKEVVKEEVEIIPQPLYPEDFPAKLKEYDNESEKFWFDFSPKIFVGEEFVFEVSYLGITAGHIKMNTDPVSVLGGEDVFKFKANMRSARFYESIYSLDDSLESIVRIKDFIPLKYTLMQRESAQVVDDLQLFDQDQRKTFFWYKRIKRGKKKEIERNVFIPRFYQDSYSALYFVRGFPLNEGDVYEFPVITRGKLWIIKIKVAGVETLDIMDKDVEAIRVNAETRFPGVLSKKGDIVFWYSNDPYRKLLKFQANVKIGSIKGELVDYREGKLFSRTGE